jgi:AraC-like DNA-binding protein
MANVYKTRMVRPLPFLAVKTGADKTYAVRRHSHETLSVGLVEKGSSRIQCHPQAFNLDEGDALLIPPGAMHLCQPKAPDRFRFRMLFICPDWLKTSLCINAAGLHPRKATLSSGARKRATAFLNSLETPQDPFLDETNAIVFLDFLFTRVFPREDRPDPRPADPTDRMARVKEFLDHHFDRDIQLDELARIAGTSKYALLRQFKQIWQITPHAYVINQRIIAAKAMLKAGHSVADTAAACGFFDQSHFVKTFKNFTGIRPTDYSA